MNRGTEKISSGPRSSPPAVLFWYIELALILILSAVYGVGATRSSSVGDQVAELSMVFVVVVVWMFASWRIWLGSLFKPFPIILLSGVVFNGGQILLESAGLNKNGLLPFHGFSVGLLENTIWYVMIGLLVFHAGGALATFAALRRQRHTPADIPSEPKLLLQALSVVGMILLAVSLPLWMYFNVQKAILALQQGYFALYQQDAAIGAGASLSILSGFAVTGVYFVAVGNRHSRIIVAIATAIILFMALIQFAQGHRATAAWPIVAYLWIVNDGIRRLPRWLLGMAGGFMLIVVFPLIAVIWNVPDSSKFSLSTLKTSYDNIGNPFVAIVSEMGSSGMVVAYTLDWVPTIRDFDKGLSYLYALTTVFPNIFGSGLHPAVARGTASERLIWQVDPSIAEAGGAIGFSFIAEAYLNFGWWLGLLSLIAVGYVISAFFNWMIRSFWYLGIAASGVTLSYFNLYARGESMQFVRPVVWYVLIPIGMVVLVYSVLRYQRPHIARGLSSDQPVAGNDGAAELVSRS